MKTALIVLDLINDIVDPNGKLGANSTAKRAKSRGIMEKANAALAIARRRGWSVVLVKVGFLPEYQEQPKHSPFFGRAHEHSALALGQWGTEFHSDLQTLATDSWLQKRASALSTIRRSNRCCARRRSNAWRCLA